MNQDYKMYSVVKELVKRFNKGDLDYLPEKQKEQIAMLAAQMGLDFKPKSKPLRKGLFDLVDTAAFGLVPNSLRPTSIGEEYFGESTADKAAGALGTLGGAIVPIGLAYKGMNYARGGGRSLMDMGKNKMADLNPLRDSIISRSSNMASNAAEAGAAGLAGARSLAVDKLSSLSLLRNALKNAPNPRTSNIVDEIFGY
tara:strand:- start:42 stop:635 length:594 start_codon:yes stop_codon:yes gene_type:complete